MANPTNPDWKKGEISWDGIRALGVGGSVSSASEDFIQYEYKPLNTDAAVLPDFEERAWIEIRGKDRASWLHNLTTNVVKTLQPGQGNYAFVLNLQGRILFDLNILVFDDHIALDLHRTWLPSALAHFNKYHITEDVEIIDRTKDYYRVVVAGPTTLKHLAEFGFSGSPALLSPFNFQTQNKRVSLVGFRSDYCGPMAIEFLIPNELEPGLSPHFGSLIGGASYNGIQTTRIEHGIPWPGFEITDEYLPAETRQLARAVSFQKGCYLGQEVVERMRSRQVVARQLVMLKLDGSETPPRAAEIRGADEKPVGKVTSSCHSVVHGAPIALGYVKTAASSVGNKLAVHWNGQSVVATVLDLPSAHVH